jgi:hypothetical protein
MWQLCQQSLARRRLQYEIDQKVPQSYRTRQLSTFSSRTSYLLWAFPPRQSRAEFQHHGAFPLLGELLPPPPVQAGHGGQLAAFFERHRKNPAPQSNPSGCTSIPMVNTTELLFGRDIFHSWLLIASTTGQRRSPGNFFLRLLFESVGTSSTAGCSFPPARRRFSGELMA